MKLVLQPDFCCGGGHCGPMPGYYYNCPHCGDDSSCRTGYELRVGEELSCFTCKGKIKALEQHSEFTFTFAKTAPPLEI